MPGQGEGELVGEGTFRIDPNRALRVLRERQLDSEVPRLGLWVRAAAVRGASRIAFRWSVRRLTIRFDGKPYSAEDLSDPFSDMLEGSGPGGNRWFATALLHTALPKVSVRVESGRGQARRAVLQDDEGIRSVEPLAPQDDATVATVRWPFLMASASAAHPYAWHRRIPTIEELAACPVRISVGREGDEKSLWTFTPLKPDPRRPNVARMKSGKTELLLCLSEGVPGLRILAAPAGVSLGWSTTRPCPLSLKIWVDDPGLTLDASLRGPVQNAELRRVVAAAIEAADRFVGDVPSRHRRSMKLAGELFSWSPALARRWSKQMGTEASAGLTLSVGWVGTWVPFRPRLSGDAKRVDECVLVTKLLREAVLKSLEGRSLDPRLARAPVLFDDQGRPLSFEDLRPLAGGLSSWGGTAPAPEHRSGRVWELSPSDMEFLLRIKPRLLAMGRGS